MFRFPGVIATHPVCTVVQLCTNEGFAPALTTVTLLCHDWCHAANHSPQESRAVTTVCLVLQCQSCGDCDKNFSNCQGKFPFPISSFWPETFGWNLACVAFHNHYGKNEKESQNFTHVSEMCQIFENLSVFSNENPTEKARKNERKKEDRTKTEGNVKDTHWLKTWISSWLFCVGLNWLVLSAAAKLPLDKGFKEMSDKHFTWSVSSRRTSHTAGCIDATIA